MKIPTRATKLVAVIGALAISIIATGCSSSSNQPQDGNSPVELTFAMYDATQKPAMQQIIDAFEGENPNISVTLQVVPRNQFTTKLRTGLAGGTGPDIFWLSPNDFPYFAKAGQLAQLDDRLKTAPQDQLTSFPPATLKGLQLDGKQLGLPRGAATVGVYYNKQLFDQAGVAYPKENWTWQDLEQAANKIADPSKNIWGVAADLNDPQKSYYNTIYQAGGSILAPDQKSSGLGDPKSVQGIEFWVNLMKNGAMPSYAQMQSTAPLAMFQAGQVALLYEGSWDLGVVSGGENIKDVMDVAPMPAGPGGQGTTLVSVGNVMNAKTKHPDEAWKFLEFLSFEKGATITAKAGVAVQSPLPTVAKIWVENYPKYNAQIFVDAESYGHPWPSTVSTQKWAQVLTTELGQAWSLKVDPGTAAKKASEGMDAILANDNN